MILNSGSNQFFEKMKILISLVLMVCLIDTFSAPLKAYEPYSQASEFSQGQQKALNDSTTIYLINASAADFHSHGPSNILNFRNVRIVYIKNPAGQKQYVLCGQFLQAQDNQKPGWIPFATIKTSGYEQMIGIQAVEYCKKAAAVKSDKEDLSALLKRRLDILNGGNKKMPK